MTQGKQQLRTLDNHPPLYLYLCLPPSHPCLLVSGLLRPRKVDLAQVGNLPLSAEIFSQVAEALDVSAQHAVPFGSPHSME